MNHIQTTVLQPNATVTVFYANSTTLATIFADSNQTPLTNPFTADVTGNWSFFALPGAYDVQFSGTGIPTPFVIKGLGITHVRIMSDTTVGVGVTLVNSVTANRTWTFQDATDTVVGQQTTDTLLNKTLTSPTINTPSINTPVISGGTLATPTINTATINTPTISGGTLATPTINTPTVNNPTINSSSVASGTLLRPIINGGIYPGSGLKAQRNAFGPAPPNALFGIAFIWTTPFVDNQYTVVVELQEASGSVDVRGITNQTPTEFDIWVFNSDTVAHSGTISAIAIHD